MPYVSMNLLEMCELFEILLLNWNFRWLCPIIGHMGIATANGVIRDFAGPYYVSVIGFHQLSGSKYHAQDDAI